MAQGIIQVSPSAVEEFIDLTIDPALIDLGKLKDVLLLPDRYTVEQVRHREFCILNGYVEVIVSSPDIPEVEEDAMLPHVSPCYCYEHISEDGKTRTFFLSDILINGVSVIREEDKERKVTIEIRDVRDPHADARDTQFMGFAKLLVTEIINQVPATIYPLEIDISDKLEKLLARRAYDFARHVLDPMGWRGLSEAILKDTPDLTAWPSNP